MASSLRKTGRESATAPTISNSSLSEGSPEPEQIRFSGCSDVYTGTETLQAARPVKVDTATSVPLWRRKIVLTDSDSRMPCSECTAESEALAFILVVVVPSVTVATRPEPETKTSIFA